MNRKIVSKYIFIFFGIMSLFFFMPSLSADAVKTNLIQQKDNIQTIISQSSLYRNDSYSAFDLDLTALGGLTYIDNVVSNPSVEQNIVDQLTTDLILLQNHLVTKIIYANIYNYFQSARNSDLSTYTSRSQILFHAKLDLIEEIIDNPRSGDLIIFGLTEDIDMAFDLLIRLADKTNLNSLMDQALTISSSDGTLYTPNSFSLFLDAYNDFETVILGDVSMTVNDVYLNNDASVTEVDSAVLAINQAMSLLTLRPDKTTIMDLYNNATLFNLTSYTPNSVKEFQDGLELVEAVIDNPNALQPDINQAILDINNLYDVLVNKANISLLSNVNTQALIAYYEEKAKYTKDSHDLFIAAVVQYGTYTYVNTVIEDLNVTQTIVDELSTKIQNALSLLVDRGNITVLQTKYEELLEIDLTPYTPSSVVEFQFEISRINQIITSPNTDQTLADETMNSIDTVMDILIELADLSRLISTIDSTDSFVEKDYTITSFGNLQSVLQNANIALNNPNVSQNEVDQLSNDIEEAISSLRTKLSPVVIQTGNEFIDINDYIVIGDSWITGYTSLDSSIAKVSPEGIVTGVDFGNTTITVNLANGLTEEIPVIVKAKITTTAFVLVLSLPFVSIGLAFVLLLTNGQSRQVLNKMKKLKEQ